MKTRLRASLTVPLFSLSACALLVLSCAKKTLTGFNYRQVDYSHSYSFQFDQRGL